jgi:hypothetical protein
MSFEMGRAGEMRQAAIPAAQKHITKKQGHANAHYPTPSSPLSRLQPYVLPSPCASTQPPFGVAVAAHVSIRDAARIAMSEPAVSKPIIFPSAHCDMMLNHDCLLLRPYDHSAVPHSTSGSH